MHSSHRKARQAPVWLFDLDDTLHDASSAAMPYLSAAMGEYIVRELRVTPAESDVLRRRYWQRYGATMLGLVRHHGVKPAHFLHHTHLLPGLEARLRASAHDLAAVARLPGRKFILTNAPAAYAARVLGVLGFGGLFERIFAIEDMQMFGHLRPKPDARMLRWMAVRLRVPASRCILVEDTLVHQKSARKVGMGTVWMQRWLPGAGVASHAHKQQRKCRKPAYVDRRVRRLQELL